MLRHFSNYVVGRGQRVEGAHQVLQVAVAPDPPEARFRLHQRRRGVWAGPGQPDAGVVDGQHRSMCPVHAGRPDRIGSLFDDGCPTAVTADTGVTERLRPRGPYGS